MNYGHVPGVEVGRRLWDYAVAEPALNLHRLAHRNIPRVRDTFHGNSTADDEPSAAFLGPIPDHRFVLGFLGVHPCRSVVICSSEARTGRVNRGSRG